MSTSKKLMDEKQKALMERRDAISQLTKNQYNRLRDYERAHGTALDAEKIKARFTRREE